MRRAAHDQVMISTSARIGLSECSGTIQSQPAGARIESLRCSLPSVFCHDVQSLALPHSYPRVFLHTYQSPFHHFLLITLSSHFMFLVNRASLLYMYCILLFGSYSKSRSNSYIGILLSQAALPDCVPSQANARSSPTSKIRSATSS